MSDGPKKTLSAEVQAKIISMAKWRPQSIADHLFLDLRQVEEVLARAKKGGRR